MEFYRTSQNQSSTEEIRNRFRLDNLEDWTSNIFCIGDQCNTEAEIGGIWGEFILDRQEIEGGLRFSFRECPNALTFTLTQARKGEEGMLLHLTVNKPVLCSEFQDEINEFLDDIHQSIEKPLAVNAN